MMAQVRDLFGKVGSFYPRRDNFRLTPEVKEKFTVKLASDPGDFYGRKVQQVIRTDGLKLKLTGGSWVCYRISGPEPVVRVYSEAGSESELERLAEAARSWIFNEEGAR